MAVIAGVGLLIVVLWDAFVTIVLPRTVRRHLGFTRPFMRSAWKVWSSVAARVKAGDRRELLLSTFAPAGLLSLITLWAFLLIFGFALVQWGGGTVAEAPEGGGHQYFRRLLLRLTLERPHATLVSCVRSNLALATAAC